MDGIATRRFGDGGLTHICPRKRKMRWKLGREVGRSLRCQLGGENGEKCDKTQAESIKELEEFRLLPFCP